MKSSIYTHGSLVTTFLPIRHEATTSSFREKIIKDVVATDSVVWIHAEKNLEPYEKDVKKLHDECVQNLAALNGVESSYCFENVHLDFVARLPS